MPEQVAPFPEVVSAGFSLGQRAMSTNAPADIAQADAAMQRVLAHPDLARHPSEYQAIAYFDAAKLRYLAALNGQSLDALDEAIGLISESIARGASDSAETAGRLYALGEALFRRAGLRDDAASLEKAIEILEHAVDPDVPGPADRSAMRDQLAQALQLRYESFGRVADRDRAIALLGG
jgi:hypothetical protein